MDKLIKLECSERCKFLRQEQGPRFMSNVSTSPVMNSVSVINSYQGERERGVHRPQYAQGLSYALSARGQARPITPASFQFQVQRTLNESNGSKLQEPKKVTVEQIDQHRIINHAFFRLYLHALNCRSHVGEGGYKSCRNMKSLLEHTRNCGNEACSCVKLKCLLEYFNSCSSSVMCQPLWSDAATSLGQATNKSSQNTGKLVEVPKLVSNRSGIEPMVEARYRVEHQGVNMMSSNVSMSSAIQMSSILKRKLSMEANTMEVQIPNFKRGRFDDYLRSGQSSNTPLNDGIRPVVGENLYMDFSKESTERFRNFSGPQLAAVMETTRVINKQVMNPMRDVGCRAAMDETSCLGNKQVMNPVFDVSANSSHSVRGSPSCIPAGVSPHVVREVPVSTGGQRMTSIPRASPVVAEVSNSIPSRPQSQEHVNDARRLSMRNVQMEIELFDVVEDPGGLPDKTAEKARELHDDTAKKLCTALNVQNVTTFSATTNQTMVDYFNLATSNQVLEDNANLNQSGNLSVIDLVILGEENFGGRELHVEKKLSMDIFQSKGNEDFNHMNEELNQLQVLVNRILGKCQSEKIVSETDRQSKIVELKTSAEREELVEMKVPTKTDKIEVVMDSNIVEPSAAQNHEKGESGVSLVYSFSPEQVREHIKQSNNQSGMDDQVDKNLCTLCKLGERKFNQVPIYCSNCNVCIKPEAYYYIKIDAGSRDNKSNAFVCKRCYKSTSTVMQKEKNSGTDEIWAECSNCHRWQHQICALFNDRMNKDENFAYTCPKCYLRDLESGKDRTLMDSYSFEAKQLPTTNLSDHIEQRLSKRLEEDRQKRAKHLGQNVSKVQGVEDLVVRVVSSVDKKVKVTNSLRKEFLKENYPEEFPYKSKAILLFQKIGGADVCIFVAYVQEYGSQCPYPNRGRVYISYIDSVNYFTPRISAATGESLRTYVYQEILIGYLDYCMRRGFTNAHVWVSPSRKRDDYILYSHPKEQKMPKPVMLRKWYQDLISKAQVENIVVRYTNLYDEYSEVAAENLPYFDGDYWPSAAAVCLNKNTELTERKPRRKPVANSIIERLGDVIRKEKDNFISVKLKHSEKNCKIFPVHEECYENCNSQDGMDDDDKEISSKIFDNRVDFLKFCEDNHYEFSSLRRAKHSTMMIIHHLLAPP